MSSHDVFVIFMDIRKKSFAVSVVRHCKRLPREVVDASSLETLKVMLDGALSNILQLSMSLFTAEALG